MRDVYQEREVCPLYTAIAVIDGRWKPMILQRLTAQPMGFGALRRALPGITTKVLRAQLRGMMADYLISRDGPTAATGRVLCYHVTPHGQSLGPVFEALWTWGNGHVAHPRTRNGTRAAPPRRRRLSTGT